MTTPFSHQLKTRSPGHTAGAALSGAGALAGCRAALRRHVGAAQVGAGAGRARLRQRQHVLLLLLGAAPVLQQGWSDSGGRWQRLLLQDAQCLTCPPRLPLEGATAAKRGAQQAPCLAALWAQRQAAGRFQQAGQRFAGQGRRGLRQLDDLMRLRGSGMDRQ